MRVKCCRANEIHDPPVFRIVYADRMRCARLEGNKTIGDKIVQNVRACGRPLPTRRDTIQLLNDHHHRHRSTWPSVAANINSPPPPPIIRADCGRYAIVAASSAERRSVPRNSRRRPPPNARCLPAHRRCGVWILRPTLYMTTMTIIIIIAA